MQYVGIKATTLRKRLLYKKDEGRKIVIPVQGMSASLHPHRDVLCRFDDHPITWENYKDSAYVEPYLLEGRGKRRILGLLKKFKKIYDSIKKNGYDYKLGYITVTADGAILDGTHRSVIIECVGIENIEVIELKWEMVCEGNQLSRIKKSIIERRNNLHLKSAKNRNRESNIDFSKTVET